MQVSCEEVLRLLKAQVDRIDVAATMDTPEEFTAFWVALSHAAGFEVGPSLDKGLVYHERDPNAAPPLSPEQREQVATVNKCSSRLVEHIRAAHRQRSNSMLAEVNSVLAMWGAKLPSGDAAAMLPQ